MDADAQQAPLRIAHRTALAAIALSAVLCALQPWANEEPAPGPIPTTAAFALGVGIIVLRRSTASPVVSETTRLVLALGTYACAIGLAGLGSYLAMNASQTRTGLAFSLAAGILCLRPLAPPTRGR